MRPVSNRLLVQLINERLLNALQEEGLPEIEGSLQIVGDLEEGSQGAARMIWNALGRSAEQL